MLTKTVTESGKNPFIHWKKLHHEASTILEKLNVRISSKKWVSELTLAEKQMVLIARAITTNCKFLILDEPTAPLSQTETKELFRIVHDLKRQNVGIIFISHRLPEIFEICDEITVMRNGEFISKELTSATTQNKVVEQMLGKKLEEQFPPLHIHQDQIVLEVNGLSDSSIINGVSLKARQGEIIGIAGLVGAGKTELCKTLFGLSSITAGEITLNGKIVRPKNPYEAVKSGIALVPEERRKEGVFVQESVSTNLTIASLGKFTKLRHFLDKKTEMQQADALITSLGVKTPSAETKVQNLSGGNQQKIAIGKWLITDVDVYIFDEPTKGVDVGAKKDIFELIVELAKRGKAILYASSETSEIMGISHRLYVLYDGQVARELTTSETSEEEILYYSAGGQ